MAEKRGELWRHDAQVRKALEQSENALAAESALIWKLSEKLRTDPSGESALPDAGPEMVRQIFVSCLHHVAVLLKHRQMREKLIECFGTDRPPG